MLVSGILLLTRLAEGSLNHVDLTAHDMPADGPTRPLSVTKLAVGLDGLQTSGRSYEAHARSVDATAFLSYEDVSAGLGVDLLRGDELGRINATAGLPLAGEVTVTATVFVVKDYRIVFMDVYTVRGELIPPLKVLFDRAWKGSFRWRTFPRGCAGARSPPRKTESMLRSRRRLFRPVAPAP
ncbi:LmeA family phospholipid-binding protein [Streptomyces sp. NRRL S-813]|uniref:LmeA family phospholipid-binding protein n=1 Tax=Streptomyces sp. NRRL S-813 TaxID=1463919 RepID=UPI00068F39FC|nr:LmeA family phospholipid-binding protein [Streptomyces sp. NRRL S-813]